MHTLNEFTLLCEEYKITHKATAPYASQSNGMIEQKKRTLLDMVNAMIISFDVPQNLWREALLSACYVLNRVPTKDREKTLYELWKGHPLRLSHFRVWGCLAKLEFLNRRELR